MEEDGHMDGRGAAGRFSGVNGVQRVFLFAERAQMGEGNSDCDPRRGETPDDSGAVKPVEANIYIAEERWVIEFKNDIKKTFSDAKLTFIFKETTKAKVALAFSYKNHQILNPNKIEIGNIPVKI